MLLRYSCRDDCIFWCAQCLSVPELLFKLQALSILLLYVQLDAYYVPARTAWRSQGAAAFED